MRLIADGPEIPDDLLRAHDQGDTVFLCGAGVSIHAGLPGFGDLVQAVYREHNERWEDHQREDNAMAMRDYELVLDHLQARLGRDIRHAVARELLSAEKDHDLSSHRVLLQLCQYGHRYPRILTTNYDHLFEQAWIGDQGSSIPIHVQRAMPRQKKPECTGILYLHGRVEKGPNSPATDSIILTSTDFAEAYVGEGWASAYLYDAIRAHSMVVVGYSAEDPLFRYLMRAIDADRRRLEGFKRVYAFVKCEPGAEAATISTWQELGVVPILYDPTEKHVALHRTLEEWLSYRNNPRRWRRETVGATLAKPPSDVSDVAIQRAIGILRYDDPTSLLRDISPAPEWVEELTNRRFFDDDDKSPAYWITSRLDDPEMIKTCAGLEVLDARTASAIGRELLYGSHLLTPVQWKAWRLILETKRPIQDCHHLDLDWHGIEEHLKAGSSGYHVRADIAELLRPTLAIQRPFPFVTSGEVAGDRLWNYVRAEYLRKPYPGSSAVLRHWPNTVVDNRDLIHILTRSIDDALEQATDVGLEASRTVPSVAGHQQNRSESGFLPITRVIVEAWSRLVSIDREEGRLVVEQWRMRPHVLFTRLVLFAHMHSAYTDEQTGTLVRRLDDATFWDAGLQVELMRLLVARWSEIPAGDRGAIEQRWCVGVPRSLYVDDAFSSEEDWDFHLDSLRFRRLSRLVQADQAVGPASMRMVEEIRERRGWEPFTDEQADFATWTESGMGPQGDPELLAEVRESELVDEVRQLRDASPWEQGGVWEIICAREPRRALSALQSASGTDQRLAWEWRSLLSVTSQSQDEELLGRIAVHLIEMPSELLGDILYNASSWLQQRTKFILVTGLGGADTVFRLWDRLFGIAAVDDGKEDKLTDSDRLATQAYNRPGGLLAYCLIDALGGTDVSDDTVILSDIVDRVTRLIDADCRAGVVGRVVLASQMSLLGYHVPDLTRRLLLPRFLADDPEADLLRRAYFGMGQLTVPLIHNEILSHSRLELARADYSDLDMESAACSIMRIAVLRRLTPESEYVLEPHDLKKRLSGARPEARSWAAWYLWRQSLPEDRDAFDPTEHWRRVSGPILEESWPRDAHLRCRKVSVRFAEMALGAGDAVPDAVQTVLGFIAPFELHAISRLVRPHRSDGAIDSHPLAVIRLLDGILDASPTVIPRDLDETLNRCRAADPRVEQADGYWRLKAFVRQ